MQIFFLPFFKKKLLDQLNIGRISGLTGYPAGQSGIRPDLKKGRIIRPDIRCIPRLIQDFD
jgi:hypothetical protein